MHSNVCLHFSEWTSDGHSLAFIKLLLIPSYLDLCGIKDSLNCSVHRSTFISSTVLKSSFQSWFSFMKEMFSQSLFCLAVPAKVGCLESVSCALLIFYPSFSLVDAPCGVNFHGSTSAHNKYIDSIFFEVCVTNHARPSVCLYLC